MKFTRIGKRTVVASAAISVALAVGGVVMSHGAKPAAYEIPSDLFFYDPYARCPTALDEGLANYVSWAVPEKRVVVGIQEEDPSTGLWAKEEYVYSTSFHVLDVAFRIGGQELFVSGVQVDGPVYTDVIEKWVFPSVSGGYVATVDGGSTPVGVPRGSFSGSTSIAGGAYVAPSIRMSTRQPVPDKTLLHSAPFGGHFDCIAADPEGRVLLMHNYTSGDVWSMDLSEETSVPELQFSAAQYPTLAAGRTMALHDVPGVGRICRLTAENRYGAYPSGTTQTGILIDSENDGIFESVSFYPSVDISRGLTPLGQSTDWQSVVDFGWDWKTEFGFDDSE